MKSLLFLCAISCAIKGLHGAEVRLLDLEPTDAQQIIEKQDQSLSYAPKIESNVPAVRYLGKEPHHVLEDIYLARQYHGQDGLGGYLYGYNVPDIAKTEKKNPSGDLKGAYNYINGDGQEIRVQYWDDGTGFHQIDNIPDVAPKQVEDSPAVKAEKDKFLARWRFEAERNSHPLPDPNQQYQQVQQYSQYPQGKLYTGYQAQGSQPQVQQVAYPQNIPPQPYGQNPQPRPVDYSGQASENANLYARSKPQEEEEETTGPPKGFFYSYDYPVGIIVQKEGVVKREGALKDIYAVNKANFESQVASGSQGGASSHSGYLAL